MGTKKADFKVTVFGIEDNCIPTLGNDLSSEKRSKQNEFDSRILGACKFSFTNDHIWTDVVEKKRKL